MSNLTGLNKVTEFQPLPGLLSVQYAAISDIVDSAPYAIGFKYNQVYPIEFKTGKGWLEADLIIDENSFSRTSSTNNQGTIHNISISGTIPFYKDGLLPELDLMVKEFYLVQFKDKLGNKFLLGSMRNPLTFTSSSIKNGRTNQHRVGWTGITRDIPPQFNAVPIF